MWSKCKYLAIELGRVHLWSHLVSLHTWDSPMGHRIKHDIFVLVLLSKICCVVYVLAYSWPCFLSILYMVFTGKGRNYNIICFNMLWCSDLVHHRARECRINPLMLVMTHNVRHGSKSRSRPPTRWALRRIGRGIAERSLAPHFYLAREWGQ